MKVSVDKDTCIGCGLCESVADNIFYLSDDGKATTKVSDLSDDDMIDNAKDAESSCPVNAIKVM